jgi:hypothetical protein
MDDVGSRIARRSERLRRRGGVDGVHDLGDVAQGSLRPGDVVAMLREQGQHRSDDLLWLAAQPPWRRIDRVGAARWAPERGRPDRVRWLRTGKASF